MDDWKCYIAQIKHYLIFKGLTLSPIENLPSKILWNLLTWTNLLPPIKCSFIIITLFPITLLRWGHSSVDGVSSSGIGTLCVHQVSLFIPLAPETCQLHTLPSCICGSCVVTQWLAMFLIVICPLALLILSREVSKNKIKIINALETMWSHFYNIFVEILWNQFWYLVISWCMAL